MGLTRQMGVVPPVLGGKIATEVLTETAKDLLGACFVVEPDPGSAYQKIKETLAEKPIGLGLSQGPTAGDRPRTSRGANAVSWPTRKLTRTT